MSQTYVRWQGDKRTVAARDLQTHTNRYDTGPFLLVYLLPTADVIINTSPEDSHLGDSTKHHDYWLLSESSWGCLFCIPNNILNTSINHYLMRQMFVFFYLLIFINCVFTVPHYMLALGWAILKSWPCTLLKLSFFSVSDCQPWLGQFRGETGYTIRADHNISQWGQNMPTRGLVGVYPNDPCWQMRWYHCTELETNWGLWGVRHIWGTRLLMSCLNKPLIVALEEDVCARGFDVVLCFRSALFGLAQEVFFFQGPKRL